MNARKWIRIAAAATGLGLCLYPITSRIVNEIGMNGAIAAYQSEVAQSEDEEIDRMMREAEAYNLHLFQAERGVLSDKAKQDKSYEDQLNLSKTGMMGTLEIPKIGVHLPISHGTGNDVLATGVGHLEGTSLPVGGQGTHSILTGHRGLPGAKLFTRLDEMEIGDFFIILIGNEKNAYKVTNIQVVEPEAEILSIEESKDKVSLVTCTPYGINTKRLVVTGERTAYIEQEITEQKSHTPSAGEVFILILPCIMIVTLIVIFFRERQAKKNETS